ncbi:DUF4062 domain-containing protein [Nesterenkonia halotolerans]|uniref:DUF4062 domain-containing protein n=1 Tax=Nesterenkonia halotolerans TaxID=225325 RepID=UPI003EE4F6ED
MRVFISSVKSGLEDERRVLPGLIRALGHTPVMFEDFGAQVDPSREACLNGVRSSDVYLLILGPHYGYRFPETGQSATHDELVEARRRSIDTIVFRKNGIEPDSDQADFISQVGDYSRGAFWADYAESTDLQTKVAAAIRQLENAPSPLTYEPLVNPPAVAWKEDWQPRSGWGQGNERTYIELHITALEGSEIPTRQISELSDALIGNLRTFGAVSMAAGVETDVTDGHVIVTVPRQSSRAYSDESPARFRGVRVARNRQVSLWTELPHTQIAAKVNSEILSSVIAEQLRLAGTFNILTGGRFAISTGLAGSMMISTGPNSATSIGLGTSGPVRIVPDESVSGAAFTLGAAEIADSLSRRIIGTMAQQR